MKMRRIAAGVLILSLAAGGYAIAQVGKQRECAQVYAETVAGDPKAAAGLSVTFGASISRSGLNWQNTYCYGDGGADVAGSESAATGAGPTGNAAGGAGADIARVEFLKSNPDNEANSNKYETAVSFEMYKEFDLQDINALFFGKQEGQHLAGSVSEQADARKKEISDILKGPFAKNAESYMKKLLADIPAGDREKRVKLHTKELLNYYILSGWISGEGDLDMNFNILCDSEGSDYELERAKDWKAWNDFFRIPVLDDEYYDVGLTKGSDGEIYVTTDYGTAEGDDDFYFNVQSCDTDEAAYFFFESHSMSGNVVDTSMIPGGYGIYRMPHGEEDGKSPIERLETVYPLDPNAYYRSISASPDGKKLFVSYYYIDPAGANGSTDTTGVTDTAGAVSASDNAVDGSEDADVRVTLFAEVIDLASRTCDEKITLLTDCKWAAVRSDSELQLFTDNESQLKIYHYEDGTYRKVVDADNLDFALPGLADIYSDRTVLCYEEGRVSALCYETIDTLSSGESERNGFGSHTPCVSAILNVFSVDGLEYCGRLYNNLQDFYDTDTYRSVGEKLWLEQQKGETFVSARSFQSGINTVESLLKLEAVG